MKKLKQKIENLISNGNLKRALDILVTSMKEDNQFKAELIHQKGRFEKIEKSHRKGILKYENYQLKIAQIQNAVLEILARITKKDLSERKALIFDIDNTVLKKGETLDKVIVGLKRPISIVGLFKDLVDLGYFIIFITGNDINKQYPKVVDPILNIGIGESVIIFSDGGSRLFEYDSGIKEFKETDSYSEENEIGKKTRFKIKREFDETLVEFVIENEMLLRPNVTSYDYEISTEGIFEFAEILIKPFNRTFTQSELLEEFQNEVFSIIKKRQIFSPVEFKSKVSNSLIIHVRGRYAHSDSIDIINIVNELLYKKKFRRISKPEYDERGGSFISQIAIKPFNNNELRGKYLKKLEKKLLKYKECQDLTINFGGTTTIDIQKKGTNKAKAIRHLTTHFDFKPKNMIYWGDEFTLNGNDIPIAQMKKKDRPSLIFHVGDSARTPKSLKNKSGIILDYAGTKGTINSLLLLFHLMEN